MSRRVRFPAPTKSGSPWRQGGDRTCRVRYPERRAPAEDLALRRPAKVLTGRDGSCHERRHRSVGLPRSEQDARVARYHCCERDGGPGLLFELIGCEPGDIHRVNDPEEESTNPTPPHDGAFQASFDD